jgi:GTP-binding protein
MKKLPLVAIIGLTNAGKSSLLNRLAHANIAITAREAGTTRDNVVATIDGRFILIDTAGLKDPADDFEASIQDQIQDAIDVADAIVLAVDSTQYPSHDDRHIAKQAHKSGKPIILALNKSDLGTALPDYEFASLGIADSIRTSATTGLGARDLKSMILTAVSRDKSSSSGAPTGDNAREVSPASHPAAAVDSEMSLEPATKTIKLALIGRPNVGKSSLFNGLAGKQQAIVANLSGTTRDINRTTVRYHGIEIELLDTAGVRRRGKQTVGIEKFSVLRTLAAIEEADICALLVDATDPHAKLDQTLAGQIIDAGKGIMLVVTKSDLLTVEETEDAPNGSPENDLEGTKPTSPTDAILDTLERDFNFIPYAPAVITSSVTGRNLTKIFDLALMIKQERETTLRTADLNRILGEAILHHPPAAVKGVLPKPKYIVQTDTTPPWFVIHGTNLKLLHFSYERYLENQIRAFHPFHGTPIKFSIRDPR